jgi:hypothetical protein
MQEYFTTVISHEHTKPSDLSGDSFIKPNRQASLAKSKSPLRESPVRITDTYRSNIILGEENNDHTLERYSTLQNNVIDHKEWHRNEYQRHVRGGNEENDKLYQSARSRSHKSLASTPTNREISSEEQSQITLSNRNTYQ